MLYLRALDVEPEHAVLHPRGAVRARAHHLALLGRQNAVRAQVINRGVHLARRVAAAVAGEDVAVHVREARGPGVVDVRRAVGVGVARGLVHANDSKVVAVVFCAV